MEVDDNADEVVYEDGYGRVDGACDGDDGYDNSDDDYNNGVDGYWDDDGDADDDDDDTCVGLSG